MKLLGYFDAALIQFTFSTWRNIIECFVYWRELFEQEFALDNTKGLYQLKNAFF